MPTLPFLSPHISCHFSTANSLIMSIKSSLKILDNPRPAAFKEFNSSHFFQKECPLGITLSQEILPLQSVHKEVDGLLSNAHTVPGKGC